MDADASVKAKHVGISFPVTQFREPNASKPQILRELAVHEIMANSHRYGSFLTSEQTHSISAYLKPGTFDGAVGDLVVLALKNFLNENERFNI